jgi:8-oxo-dGTP pyrophosphatase MutT (NUDIX family)
MENINSSELDSSTPKKYILDEEVNLCTGKYFRMSQKKYHLENNTDKKIIWECVYRTNIEDYKRIYGAEIVALVRDDVKLNNGINKFEDISILLIENYRYPVEKKVLEFPSGLIDLEEHLSLKNSYDKINECNDEILKKNLISNYEKELEKIAISSAKRELKEETGYHGEFKSFFTPPNVNAIKVLENVFYDPWKGLENAAFCIFEIDKSSDLNKNPKQELDDAEVIKVHEVKLSEMLNFITEKIEKENYGCSTHVYSFAMGLQFSNLIGNYIN